MINNISNNEEILYNDAVSIIDTGRKKVVESIYNETTRSYYALGRLIIVNEQDGKIKAQYGKNIIQNLSKKLTLKYGKGFSVSTIKDCRQFYKKLQSLTGELDFIKSQSMTGESKFKLSFTHYTYLMRLDDEEMKFYEKYAIEQNLTVRQLQKEIQNNTILRIKETKELSPSSQTKPKDIIKDPYILDFLGLDEIKNGDEKVNDNKTIGILLCNDKNEKVVEYTLPQNNEQIFASKYKLYLPSKEELVGELNNENN